MHTLSRTENRDLMLRAREALSGRWGLAVGGYLVFCLIVIGAQMIPKVGNLISMILAGPMTVGLTGFSLCLARRQEARIEQIFDGFKKFRVALFAYVAATVFVLLWALLLIIPGIIAAFSYAMTYYIIAESESIGPLEAIARSKELMQGNKWKFFCLGARFFGWSLLCALTLGIGFLWLLPYMSVAFARFYDDLKPVSEGMQEIDSSRAITV